MTGDIARIMGGPGLSVVLFLFGLVFGSFANVVIWRFPRGGSLSSPGSHCPACEHPIRWHDNIPLLSWVLLRGRCRDCDAKIPIRYPLVELTAGLLCALAAVSWGFSTRTLFGAVFFYGLLILAVIDADTMRLPNPIVALLALAGIGGAAFSQLAHIAAVPLTPAVSGPLSTPLAGALGGAALGMLVSLSIAGVYALVRRREGFGMGDVKLLGAMGLFLGPYVVISFVAGSLIGAVWGVAGSVAGHGALARKIPFGPFLAAGGVFSAVLGPTVWRMYLNALGL